MMLPPFGVFEFPYPKACHVYLNGTQVISSLAWTPVAVNAVLWDTYGLYTGGGAQYITVSESGLYVLLGKIKTVGIISIHIAAGVFYNGNYDFSVLVPPNGNGDTHVYVIYMKMLSSGDKLDLRVFWPGTGTITIGDTWQDCFLQVLKLPYITKGY
jgi:hypothetical protein